jgi:hypothetical protein
MELDGLASVIGANLLGRVEEVWDSIESALRQAFLFGRDEASQLMNAATEKVEQLLKEAGQKAREIQDAILERLHAFTEALFQGMLSRITTTMKIGASEFTLRSVKLNQKLVATGSVKTNLAEVLSLAANGEIEVNAEYMQSSSQAATA